MISVVVPALNKAARLPALLRALHAEPVALETIVVDGQSSDGTTEAARAAGATLVLSAPRGRGQQLAAGVAGAGGEVVLFLHADSVLSPGGLVALERLLRDRPDLVGGNFRLLFDGGDVFSRWLTGFYAAIRQLGSFYGDSGIFIRCRFSLKRANAALVRCCGVNRVNQARRALASCWFSGPGGGSIPDPGPPPRSALTEFGAVAWLEGAMDCRYVVNRACAAAEDSEAVSKQVRYEPGWAGWPGCIVIRPGCDTLDERRDVDPDHPAAA